MKNSKQQIILVSILVLMAAFWRIGTAQLGLYSIVPVAAMGLFSGAILSDKKWAYLIPLATMFISDMLFAAFTNTPGFYGVSQIVNYGALALVTFMGTQMNKKSVLNIIGYTLSGSLVFFLLSNFGTFLSGYYGYTGAGFIECYVMALPFYKSEMATQFFSNAFMGDLAFSLVAFGVYYVVAQKQMKTQLA